ncbi:MAG TPA: superoxide dismutase [Stellaceae bacterium]|nr:superoxide dismutase [Stellaceae bacterium]
MAFELPSLPYPESALEPFISADTMRFHHGKHHQAYVITLNKLVQGGPLAAKSLEEIIRVTAGDQNESSESIFNNAAQHWNHEFFWNSMKPKGGGSPTGDLGQRIDRDFGGLEKFKEMFQSAAVGQFGSGWAWLIAEKNELKIMKTANAMTPIAIGKRPLLACDVWEHAYYLDYQNRRPDFVRVFLDRLMNWDFAASNSSLSFAGAESGQLIRRELLDPDPRDAAGRKP